MKSNRLVLILAITLFVSACGTDTSAGPTSTETVTVTEADASEDTSTGMGRGMGRNSGMMDRHRSTVPDEYAGLTNPIVADEESLARGAEAYSVCAACHGDGGLGDGPAGVNLDPAPVNIAHTSQMTGDDYLFWRISEGGAQFETSMPAWNGVLDEQTIWDLINYVQALGVGTVAPRQAMGGEAFDPGAQAVQQAALLAAAVEQGVITQDESDLFAGAHEVVDARMAELRGTIAAEMLVDVLAELVTSGDLTQDQADGFLSVHDRLSEAGLLP